MELGEFLPGRYRTWAPEKTGERGEAAGVSRPAYWPRAPSGRNPNTAPPRRRSIAPKLQLSHKHRTVSSSLSDPHRLQPKPKPNKIRKNHRNTKQTHRNSQKKGNFLNYFYKAFDSRS